MTRLTLLVGSLAAAVLFTTTPARADEPVRIGIVLPEAQLGQGNGGQDVAEPVRQLIIGYMAGPRLEIVPLQARIPAQIDAEAVAQNCRYVLVTRVAQKKAGKGFGGMMGMLGPAASMLPGLGAMGGAGSAMVTSVASQAIATAAMHSAQQDAMASLSQAQSGSVKAKDEISLSYQLLAVGDAKPVIDETLKAKAKENGEDLLRPLIEQVATKTVTAALAP